MIRIKKFVLFLIFFIIFFNFNSKANEKTSQLNEFISFVNVSNGVNQIKTTIVPNSSIINKEGNLQIVKNIYQNQEVLDEYGNISFIIGQKRKITQEEYKWLCQIVQAEAGNQDIIGRILVANVIFNRVDSYHSNIKSVIFAPHQFQPVSNGAIYRVQPSSETINAVNQALDGIDYSEGALYFMNRAGSESKNITWFDTSLTFLFKHGGHEFFK